VFERLGLGWERLQAVNRSIIYISISGFGHSGRDAGYVTWGPTAQAVSGCTHLSGLPGQPPAGWGFSYLDHVAGYYGAIAALLALHHRSRTGAGQYIDIAQVETGLYLCGVPILDYQVNGRPSEPVGNRSRYPAVAPHGIYPCAGDDRWIAIVAETEAQWQALCEVLASPALSGDPRFETNLGRLAAQDELDAIIGLTTRSYDCYDLMYRLQARGVPAGAVQNTADKLERDPQLKARAFYPVAAHPVLGEHRFEGVPLRFSRSGWALRRPAPLFGEHTAEILGRILGYTKTEIERLMEEAAV
jgi:crotonobetainyl-CoA:carnitine CoA-transferase CaiB-like acyl-CoA transferase